MRAKSPAGAVGAVERAPFTVDLSDPQTSFTGQKKAATVLDPSTAITFGSTASGSSYRCKVDKGSYRTCTSPYVVGGMGPGRHRLSVEATDSAGNVDPTPAARTLVVDQAAAAGTLFRDDFETGNLSRWTVTKGGTGTAAAQTAVVRTGTYAARFTTTSDAGSRAYARTSLTAAVADLTSVADVRVDTEGASGGSVPLLRYFGDTGTRTVNLYRANATGKIWVQYGSTFAATSGTLPLGTWGNVSLRAAGGTLQVVLNGTSVYSTTTAGLAPTRTLQIGNEAAAQRGTVTVDDVSASATGSDLTPPETTISAGPSATVPNGQATFEFTSSEASSTFQCSLDAAAYTPCTSPKAYSGLAKGSHTFNVRAADASGNVDPTPATRTWTAAGDPTPAVMVADNQNRRILVTDYTGKILWAFDNPTGEASAYSGPLGVRLLPNGHILATFGTGTVGEIDMTTKTFVWKVKGYSGAFFQSPYDAELMPDGNIAVANAKATQVVVFNHSTGAAGVDLPDQLPALRGAAPGRQGPQHDPADPPDLRVQQAVRGRLRTGQARRQGTPVPVGRRQQHAPRDPRPRRHLDRAQRLGQLHQAGAADPEHHLVALPGQLLQRRGPRRDHDAKRGLRHRLPHLERRQPDPVHRRAGRPDVGVLQPERRHPSQPALRRALAELAGLTGQTGRTTRSLTVASVGRSSTCRIASATVSGRIHWPASYARPSCSCTFCCIGVAVRPG